MAKDRIGEFLSYDEVVKTSSKKKNVPTEDQLGNIKEWYDNVFHPVRVWAGGPINANSIFRSKAVNDDIGGSPTSEHMCNNGSAAGDLDATTVSNSVLFHYIRKNLPFNQLIAEFPVNGEPAWVHVSYNKTNNKKQVLVATKRRGKTVYLSYETEGRKIVNL